MAIGADRTDKPPLRCSLLLHSSLTPLSGQSDGCQSCKYTFGATVVIISQNFLIARHKSFGHTTIACHTLKHVWWRAIAARVAFYSWPCLKGAMIILGQTLQWVHFHFWKSTVFNSWCTNHKTIAIILRIVIKPIRNFKTVFVLKLELLFPQTCQRHSSWGYLFDSELLSEWILIEKHFKRFSGITTMCPTLF